MTKKAKLLIAIVVFGQIASSKIANADYVYNFTYNSNENYQQSATGTFSIPVVSSPPGSSFEFSYVNASFNSYGGVFNVNSGTGFQAANGQLTFLFSDQGSPAFNFLVRGNLTDPNGSTDLGGSSLSGSVQVYNHEGDPATYNGSQGFFEAILSSGSSSGGGTGGAPTPEVNVGLGILLAGATFAFLRRKRGGQCLAKAA